MPEESESTEPESDLHPGWYYAAGALVVILLYFLTPGFLIGIIISTGIEVPEWLEYAFVPVEFLYDRSATNKGFINWQLDLFN